MYRDAQFNFDLLLPDLKFRTLTYVQLQYNISLIAVINRNKTLKKYNRNLDKKKKKSRGLQGII